MFDDLKFTVAVTGKSGESKANIRIDFDPPMSLKQDAWSGSGALGLATVIIQEIKKYYPELIRVKKVKFN